jgi:hypothetical protein
MSEQRQNPFPGPQPYRAADRRRFFGREEMAEQLVNRVLSRPCTTVFGPSGAGKSSLMQAAVIPLLEETRDTRVVCVDTWPAGEAPLPWLVRAVFTDLDLGTPPEGKDMIEALDEALSLAELRSERPILIYLDQIEQALFPGRASAEAEALLEGIERVANRPVRGLQVVLSLREDYLGRLRDRARGRRELLDLGFRVAPLSVGEMVKAVCRAAAAGEPGQRWDEEEIRRLMLEVRVPGDAAWDEAEVQAAFGQIVCRELWEERAAGSGPEAGPVEAEAILHRYLEATVEGLGAHQEEALRFLEEHLIDKEGRRRLLTEFEARDALPEAAMDKVLEGLERAAVLRAEAHQGRRYFELGHDWLARRVFDRREARRREEAARKRWEEEQEARRNFVIRALRLAARHPLVTALGALLLLAAGYIVITALLLARAQHDAFRATDLAARRTADLTALQIESFAKVVEEAAREPLVVAAVASAQAQDLAGACEALRARSAAAHFDSWTLFDTRGIYLSRAPIGPIDNRGRAYDFRDYFLGAKKLAEQRSRSAYVSTAYHSETDGTFRVALAVPVYDAAGSWIAVLVAGLATGSALGSIPLDDRHDDRLTVAIIAPRGRERADGDREHDPIFLVHRRLGPGEALVASTDTGPDTGALVRLAPVRGTLFSVLVRFSYDSSLVTRLGRMEVLIAWMPIAAAGALLWGLFRWARRRGAIKERPPG